jgi:hypothetical protein
MTTQYRGEIINFSLSQEINGKAVLVLQIPKLHLDIELGDEGSIKFLKNKYPFINGRPGLSLARAKRMSCLVEKEGDVFKYTAYLAVNHNVVPSRI